MTCIVGLVENGKVYMGADSAGSSGRELDIHRDSKLFRVGPFLVGFTTSFRMGQLLRYKLSVPTQTENQDPHAYMATDFVDSVRKCLKAGGYAKKESEVEIGGTFLVAYQGHLYQVQDDYQVMESINAYDSCGCGQAIALGVMFATKGREEMFCSYPDILPENRILLALEAAEQFNNGVRRPFRLATLPSIMG